MTLSAFLVLSGFLTGTMLTLITFGTGYHFLSKFFMLIIFLSTWYLIAYIFYRIYKYAKKEENPYHDLKTVLEVYTVIFVFVALQASWPVFSLKIDLPLGQDLYGFIDEEGNSFIARSTTIDIYPPLFPITGISNCQQIPLGEIIRDPKEYRDMWNVYIGPSDDNQSLILCIRRLDGWVFNKISVPIYYEIKQELNYRFESSIDSILENTTTDGDTYLYEKISFNNFESFRINNAKFKSVIFDNSSAWKKLIALNKTYENGIGFLISDYSEPTGHSADFFFGDKNITIFGNLYLEARNETDNIRQEKYLIIRGYGNKIEK